MKRTRTVQKREDVIGILTGDWHQREDQPICRTDDYWPAQLEKLAYISKLREKYRCPIYHSGDLFHHWKPSPNLLSTFIEHFSFPYGFYTCLGNHDLPQHSVELAYRSGVWTLKTAGYIDIVPFHWEQEPNNNSILIPGKLNLLIWHQMTWKGKSPWPDCQDPQAHELIEQVEHLQPDIILTGHNHRTFTEHHHGITLINPGSLMRYKADQENHSPCVYLLYSDGSYMHHEIPHTKNVISREHIEAKGEDSSRYRAFLQNVRRDAPEISFRSNLEEFFKQQSTTRRVRELVWESLEE